MKVKGTGRIKNPIHEGRSLEALIRHYDSLIAEENDPVHDPKPLQDYMAQWDGSPFIRKMMLNKTKTALEIGIGTGRLALKTAALCKHLTGIDLSPKTIERARANLSEYRNVSLICADFMAFPFEETFDVIYSSLTFMHIKNKRKAIQKAARLLKPVGRFVLSIDKNQSEWIDMGTRSLKIYPDTPAEIRTAIEEAGLLLTVQYETELGHILIADKKELSAPPSNP